MRSLLRLLFVWSWAVPWWALSITGCASWEPAEPPPSLPSPRISPDSVVLEIEHVPFDDKRLEDLERVWHSVDETGLSPELRHQLADNGLRAGVLDTQLPPVLRAAIAEKRTPLNALEETSRSGNPSQYRQLPCRAGRKYDIEVTGAAEDHVALLVQSGFIRAASFEQSQGLVRIVTAPRGDGRVTLTLTPVVKHGQVRQRYKPGPANFIMDPRQEEEQLDFLRIAADLSPGATFVVGTSPDPKGIGGWFFGAGKGSRSVFLVRLMQTQYDDLFSSDSSGETLTTPLE